MDWVFIKHMTCIYRNQCVHASLWPRKETRILGAKTKMPDFRFETIVTKNNKFMKQYFLPL